MASSLLPIILFITLELPDLAWPLLKLLIVQLLNTERCSLKVFLRSAGALCNQTHLPTFSLVLL